MAMVALSDTAASKNKARRRRGRKGKEEAESNHTNNHSNSNKNKQHSADSDIVNNNDISHALTFKPHKSILIHLTDDTPTWFECGRHTLGRDDTVFTVTNMDSEGGKKHTKVKSNPTHLVQQYETLAEQIYQHEVELFKSHESAGSGKSSDERWVENTMRRGTLKDRIAAMSVTFSTDPVHKLHALDMLLDMCGCAVSSSNGDIKGGGQPNARVGQMAAEALLDLFLNTLLPPHRKLVSFGARPLYLYGTSSSSGDNTTATSRTLSPRLLLLWHYESLIKTRYASFLSRYLGRTLASDSSLDEYKRMALQTATDLLRDVPEGESTLLSMIVNKLGDPSRKIASCAGHQLRMVLEKHPVMVEVIAREVQQLAHRPHLSSRALYNCIIFLNQLKLVKDDDDDVVIDVEGDSDDDYGDKNKSKQKQKSSSSLPASLINTYFRLFEVAIKKTKNEKNNNNADKSDDAGIKSRLLSALLTGVNRAHPFLPRKDAAMEKHVDALYRIAHTAPPAASTQALMLLFHLAVGTEGSSGLGPRNNSASYNARMDRFYRALYSKVGDPTMLVGRQLTMFFNLVYKAAKHDPDGVRSVALAKRLLHTSAHSSAPIIAGTLFLVSEVMKIQPMLMESVNVASMAIFDPMKREPKAAFRAAGEKNRGKKGRGVGEEVSGSLWEVSLLSHHFHPSVSKFGENLGEIEYNGDPLRDFALAPFLDKFAYRNPKSVERISRHIKRGESIAERRSGIEGGIHLATARPVNNPDFIKKNTVGEEEEFFHKFFVERAKRDEIKGLVRGSNAAAKEDDILDAVESRHVDKLDEGWDTESDEEKFAQGLAEKLIEQHSHGKAHFDDEDPDMEGWSDLDDNDDDDDEEEEEGEFSGVIEKDSDEDIDGSDDSSVDVKGGITGDGDDFMDADDSDSDDGDGDGQGGPRIAHINDMEPFDDNDSDGNENAFELGEFPDSDLDDSSEDDDNGKKKEEDKKKGKQKLSMSFADASEYESIIEKGWAERKRGREMGNNEEPNDVIETSKPSKQRQDGSGKKRKKKRKQR